MKNEIREAYDRMNPSTEAKERMMRNMMKKEKSVRAYGPVQDSYGWWSAVPAILLLVVILAVGWKVILPGGESPLTDNPVATATPTDQATPDNSFAENLIPEGYDHVLEKYIQAHKENWTPEEYSNHDMSYVLGMKESILEYGYALLDLNGDQVDELLITDGELIIDLYALLEDGSVNHLLSGGERMRYFLCEDNIIGYHGSGGASNTLWSFDRLQPNGEFQYEVQLEFDTDTWYKFTNSGTETPGGVDVLSPEQAEQLIAGYAPVEIPFQVMVRMDPDQEIHDPVTYADLLRQKMEKHPGVTNMFVGLVDVSGDGVSELLLGTADSFGQVYTIENGTVREVFTYGTDEGFHLCADGVIMYHKDSDPYYQYSFVSMHGNDPVTLENICYSQDEGRWYRNIGDRHEPLTDEQKQEIIDSYGTVKLAMIPVSEYLAGE